MSEVAAANVRDLGVDLPNCIHIAALVQQGARRVTQSRVARGPADDLAVIWSDCL